MKNPVAGVCKITSLVVFILSLLGGIFSGYYFGEYGEFSFSITFYIWAGSFLYCLFLFAIGEIIKQLTISNMNSCALQQLLKKIQPEAKKSSSFGPPSPACFSKPAKTIVGGWVCKRCATSNYPNTIFCKGCGEYRY